MSAVNSSSFNNLLQIDQMTTSGTLNQSFEILPEKVFQVGDLVSIRSDNGEKEGAIIGIRKDQPYHAQVELIHNIGISTVRWVKTEHLSKKDVGSS